MSTVKNLLAVVCCMLLAMTITRWVPDESVYLKLFCGLFFALFFFNLSVQNRLDFKPYFLSKWNFLSGKYRKDIAFDMPKELMFEKVVEVIENSTAKLRHADKERLQLLATSALSWKSWGEMIYITILEEDVQTFLRFESAALLQIYTWGKNEANFNAFVCELEDSLTI